MEDIGLSLQDLYPSPMSPIGPIQAFVLEGTKMKTPEMPVLLSYILVTFIIESRSILLVPYGYVDYQFCI